MNPVSLLPRLVGASRGHFSDNGLCQLRPRHFRVRVLVAFRGLFSDNNPYKLRPWHFRVRVLVASHGHFLGRFPCHSELPQVSFQKHFDDKMERRFCSNKKCKCCIKCNESPENFGGGECDAHP
jgi:hypothetical protein